MELISIGILAGMLMAFLIIAWGHLFYERHDTTKSCIHTGYDVLCSRDTDNSNSIVGTDNEQVDSGCDLRYGNRVLTSEEIINVLENLQLCLTPYERLCVTKAIVIIEKVEDMLERYVDDGK